MWLIDVDTWKLKNFSGREVFEEMPYAILSHTWGADEVTFQDMQNLDVARQKSGWWKIRKTCEQAKVDGLQYAWVDTCCIDKTSSTELQEAINSMFEWYAHPARCYALLADILLSGKEGQGLKLSRSRWFSRGWTLQELIAPHDVDFYDQNWDYLGARSRWRDEIADHTGIAVDVLRGGFTYYSLATRHLSDKRKPRILAAYSVAQRMSWAAGRSTTRLEDRAYSLLGFFKVTMPLLYGEGERSFTRLQEEILGTKAQPDLSLLLWEKDSWTRSAFDRRSLFAMSPDAFRKCSSIVCHRASQPMENSADMAISSAGMKAKLQVMPLHVSDHEDADYAAILHCYDEHDVTSTIALKLVSQKKDAHTNSLLEQEYSREQTLTATPYTVQDITAHGAQTRAVRIDIMEAQQRSVLTTVFMAREKPWSLNKDGKKQYIDNAHSHPILAAIQLVSCPRAKMEPHPGLAPERVES